MSATVEVADLGGPAVLEAAAPYPWGWYLAGGIASVLFGFLVLSYRFASLVVLSYFACAYLICVGLFQLVGSFRAARRRWLYLVMGVLSVGAGIVGLVWPGITLFVFAVLLGWALLFWGMTDLVHSLTRRHDLEYWWLYLIRGLVSILIGIWAVRHLGRALVAFIIVLGLWAIVYGVVEVIAALGARRVGRPGA
jgi:uncharacterized membrane protein HdeD (DUF308 family)